jgi:hypothetical protein
MDRLEDRMARNGNGHKRHWLTYLKHIPWQFLILHQETAGVLVSWWRYVRHNWCFCWSVALAAAIGVWLGRLAS